MFKHHESSPSLCPGCDDRLNDADPELRKWFEDMKGTTHNLHISWAYRDKSSQDEAFSKGLSKLEWPKSKHNFEVNGKPQARALDVFKLDDVGRAVFDEVFFATLNSVSLKRGWDLRWGGNFKSLGDSGHFELKDKSI